MLHVLIVDDHAIVRAGLKGVLADVPDMTVSGEAGGAQEALDKVRDGRWDVIVLDLSLPGRSGIEVLQILRSQPMSPPVLMLSVHDEEQYAPRLLRLGAAGYLNKRSAPQELVTAIRRVAQGGKYISPALAEYLAFGAGPESAQPRHAVLSPREFQVLCLIAAGKTTSEMAADLSISGTTVSTHRAHILEKMGLKSTADVVQYALAHRLVAPALDLPTP